MMCSVDRGLYLDFSVGWLERLDLEPGALDTPRLIRFIDDCESKYSRINLRTSIESPMTVFSRLLSSFRSLMTWGTKAQRMRVMGQRSKTHAPGRR